MVIIKLTPNVLTCYLVVFIHNKEFRIAFVQENPDYDHAVLIDYSVPKKGEGEGRNGRQCYLQYGVM